MHNSARQKLIAAARAESLGRPSAGRRRAREAVRRPLQAPSEPELTLRFAFPDDDQALRALAALDSAPPLVSPVLLAEVAGEPRAGLSLADGRAIADPFHYSEWVITLLRARAAQLSKSGQGRRSAGRVGRVAGQVAARAVLRLAGPRA